MPREGAAPAALVPGSAAFPPRKVRYAVPMPSGPIHELEALLRAVDDALAALRERHQGRLRCRRGCSGCCVDGIAVLPVEADLIRAHHGELLDEGLPFRAGACAFLDD